jgi:hypothetical protein
MDGYRPAVMVSLIAAALGVVATVAARRRRPEAPPGLAVDVPVRELVEG